MKSNNHQKNKKILFVLRIPPPHGGGEIVSLELYNKLKNKYSFLLIHHNTHSKSKQGNINLFSFIRGIQYIFKIIIRLLKQRPQILYIGISKSFGSFMRDSIVYLVAKCFRIKMIGEIHGMSFLFLDNKIARYYYKFVINKFDKIRVLSNSTKEYLKHTGFNGMIISINNGISRPEVIGIPSKKKGSTYFKLLYFGAISSSKGFFRTLEILKYLLEKNITNWELNVIGEWVYQNEMQLANKFIETNKLGNKIHFFGKVIDEKKWFLLPQHDIMIHLTDYDGQPLTIIEAMSVGIPVIATKVGGIPEMITNDINGFLVADENCAKQWLIKILKGKVDFQKISKEAIITFEEKYTSNKMSREIEEIINC